MYGQQQQQANGGAGGWYGAGQDVQYYQQGAPRSGQYVVTGQPATGRLTIGAAAAAKQTPPVSSPALVKEDENASVTVEVVDSDSVN